MHDIAIDDRGMLLMEFHGGVFATLDPSCPDLSLPHGEITEIIGQKA